MVGDIKLATLSDTEAADNTEYVGGYGDFTDGNAWTKNTGWSTGSNVATKTASTGANYISRASSGTFVSGEWYQAEFDLLSGNGTHVQLVNRHTNGVLKPYTNATNVDVAFFAVGSKCYAIWKQNTNNTNIVSLYASQAVSLDNFKIYKISADDRSYYNCPMLRAGTVTKTAVATGADLLGYSGFSGSNGLLQPYKAELEPGTGDYSVMIWLKTAATTSEQTIFRRFGNPTVTGGLLLRIVGGSTSGIQWYTRDTSSNVGSITTTTALDDSTWHHVVGTRQGATMSLYIDGKLYSSVATSASSHNAGTTARMHIGVEETTNLGVYSNPSDVTNLALARYALAAPSAEQIVKIYNDEKHLFQENAKATLYGTSDAVTALAYDDDTESLHVGTSAGRSVFQGLNRVDNTTDAVGAAISASNGLVAED
jgi:hypothetical protein